LTIEDPDKLTSHRNSIQQIEHLIEDLQQKNNKSHEQTNKKQGRTLQLLKKDIPSFQLISNDVNTKVLTKASYSNVETFIFTFEPTVVFRLLSRSLFYTSDLILLHLLHFVLP
jgi:hypothetical protein